MYHENRSQKTKASAAREAGASVAELGLEVASEFLPDSLGLFSLLIYAAAFVLLALIWAGRTVFRSL